MAVGHTVVLETYANSHFEGVRSLWQECFPDDPPWNEAAVAIPAKLAIQPELLIVALDSDAVIGSIMPAYDGHRGWLYALAVRKSHRRRGIGTLLVREAERRLEALGCSKVNLQIRSSNGAVAQFYQRLGYDVEERLSLGRRLRS